MRKLFLLLALLSPAMAFGQGGTPPGAYGSAGGGGAGLAFVAAAPATCTPGVTASIQLSVSPYSIEYCSATNTWTALSSGGSVTSAALAVPSWLAVTGSPITTAGTFTVASATGLTSHEVVGTCGSATTVSLCALVAGDIPTLNQSTTGTAANLSGTPALPNGTTATTQSAADNTTKIATDAFVLANAGTMNNPMTTLGDQIYGGASGAPTRLAGPTTPNGVPQSVVDVPAAGAAVAEIFALPGVTVRAVTGTTSTDTIVSTDCNPKTVAYQGSVAVAVTLPTATTLAVPACVFRLVNNTSGAATAVTITPTTWTVNGGATLVLAQGQQVTFYVDPGGSSWDAVAGDEPATAGTGIALTRSQYGFAVAVTTGIPIADVGSAGLSATSPLAVASTGAMTCTTCTVTIASA